MYHYDFPLPLPYQCFTYMFSQLLAFCNLKKNTLFTDKPQQGVDGGLGVYGVQRTPFVSSTGANAKMGVCIRQQAMH